MTDYSFKNPIIPGFYPDPSITRAKDGYYLVCSSFEYFPGVPLFFSKNLFSWKQIGYCLTTKAQLDLSQAKASDGIYAPTIRYQNGIFYLITTNINLKKHILVTCKNPKKETWSEPIYIEQEGIDPSLFFDDNGNVYLTTSGNQRIVQSQIDVNTGSKLSPEKVIWSGIGFKFPEGPHLYKIKGEYFLFISEGGTEYNHMITVAKSSSPFGKFIPCPNNPILSHAGKINEIQATGHGDIVKDANNKWWMVALGVRPNGYPPTHHLGRETFLLPLSFGKDTWPKIKNKEIPLTLKTAKRYTNLQNRKKEDNFETPKLKDYWNFLRFSNQGYYEINSKQKTLSLKCLPADINSTKQQSFLGMRQQHFDCTFETFLTFTPLFKEQAGICVRSNESHYYLLTLETKNGNNILNFTRKIGSLISSEKQVAVLSDKVKLLIKADRNFYYFYYAKPSTAKLTLIGKGETKYLSTEVAGGFTGVYFGLYCSAVGKQSHNAAKFKQVKYIPA